MTERPYSCTRCGGVRKGQPLFRASPELWEESAVEDYKMTGQLRRLPRANDVVKPMSPWCNCGRRGQ